MTLLPAITIWQPWASLIAAGLKPYEFRGWPAPERLIGGRIAIHAGARAIKPREVAALIIALRNPVEGPRTGLRPIEEALAFLERVHTSPAILPLSSVLATATLGRPIRADRLARELGVDLGNDSDRPGTFSIAWPLTDVRRLEPFVSARGRQGIWGWEGELGTICESCGRAPIYGNCPSCNRDRAEGEEFADRHGMPWEAGD